MLGGEGRHESHRFSAVGWPPFHWPRRPALQGCRWRAREHECNLFCKPLIRILSLSVCVELLVHTGGAEAVRGGAAFANGSGVSLPLHRKCWSTPPNQASSCRTHGGCTHDDGARSCALLPLAGGLALPPWVAARNCERAEAKRLSARRGQRQQRARRISGAAAFSLHASFSLSVAPAAYTYIQLLIVDSSDQA